MARSKDRSKLRRCRLILPPTHNSDHRAMVVKMKAEGGVKQYKDGRKQLPFQKPKKADMSEGGKLFESLSEAVEKPRRRERER